MTFRLCVPRDELSVCIVRGVCRSTLVTLGVARPCVEDIELAVTEACTNVLKHADGTASSYDVTISVDASDCDIRIVDSGAGFDHAATSLQEVLAGNEGGRGILLMRALVDSVHFASIPAQGTIVHLQKHLDLTDRSILRGLATADA
jgi:serine/threonine-protein kinase RsbW